MKTSQPTPIQIYAQAFAELTPDKLHFLLDLMSEDVVFEDPFNQIQGLQKVRSLFEDMYERLDSARFFIAQVCEDPGQNNGFIRWRFEASSGLTGEFSIEGVSEIVLDGEGKIVRHLDFWDGSELMKRIPVLGWVLRRIKAKLAVPD